MHFELAVHNYDKLPEGKIPRTMLSEIAEIVLSVEPSESPKEMKSTLSRQFKDLFGENGWELDTNLLFEPAKAVTMHFLKKRTLCQVSWRHYEMIGTEMLKFQTDFAEDKIDGGVFVCITQDFLEAQGTFGGSITMETALRYLSTVSETIQLPIVLVGLLPNGVSGIWS